MHSGQGERQGYNEPGPFAQFGNDLHLPLQSFHVGAHHIQPHPTSRNISDHSTCAESGQKNEVQKLGLGPICYIVFLHNSLVYSRFLQPQRIDALAVILKDYQHFTTFLPCPQFDGSRLRFARFASSFGRLNAMVQSVPQQVDKRVADLL